MKNIAMLLTLATIFTLSSQVKAVTEHELDPNSIDIEEQLNANDELFSEFRVFSDADDTFGVAPCYRETCDVYLEVSRVRQRAVLRVNGQLVEGLKDFDKGSDLRITTGGPGHGTPAFDQLIDVPLRAYSKYSSSKYPGGDWNGLGNMPYAVFIRKNKGWAVHGTTPGNILKLGKAINTKVPLKDSRYFAGSHGCVRIHPLNAKKFNAAVQKYGARRTWIRMID